MALLLEQMLKNLQINVKEGNLNKAKSSVHTLFHQQAKYQDGAYLMACGDGAIFEPTIKDNENENLYRLVAKIEDCKAVDHKLCICLLVPYEITIQGLKAIVEKEFHISPRRQEWIFTRDNVYMIARDDFTLTKCGISNKGAHSDVYLYIKNKAFVNYNEIGKNTKENDTLESPPNWECPKCTTKNSPLRPGCVSCSTDRPENYIIPAGYQATEEEKNLLQIFARNDRLLDNFMTEEVKNEKLEAQKNFAAYQRSDDISVLPSTTEFECDTCMSTVEIGNGIMLRNCGDQVCKGCFTEVVKYAEGGEVRCPVCHIDVQQREIKALVDNATWELYERSCLNRAEQGLKNSYHCRTPNCTGFCEIVDEVHEFQCYVCKFVNCLRCRAVHVNMTCAEYQEDLKIRSKNDADAKATMETIERLVANGEAMKCPNCSILIFKKEGCDWLQCSCKTELCWATKGARWGPKGKGDTSGGCRCRVGGVYCHPQCKNCH